MVRLLSCEVNMAKARLTKMAKLLLYAKQRGYVGVIQLDVDLDGIEVYWLESKEFDYDDLVFVDKNKTSIKFRKLKKGKTYYFRICSWSKSGVVSPWSKIVKVRIN